MLMEQSVHVMAVTLYVPGCFYFPFLKIHIFLTPLSVLFFRPFFFTNVVSVKEKMHFFPCTSYKRKGA